jgi:predicted transcriptional regulator with HTH domain
MFTEDDILLSYFTEKDIKGVSSDEFQIAMIGLVGQGLIEIEVRDGVRYYKPTLLLKQIKTHHYSKSKIQN